MNMALRRIGFTRLAPFVLCAVLPHATHAQEPPPGVFSEAQTAVIPHTSATMELATVRSRVAQVDTQKITAARRGRDTLKLNLFDDEVVEVRIKRVRPTRTGYFISGTPSGAEWGEVRLVVNGPVMWGPWLRRKASTPFGQRDPAAMSSVKSIRPGKPSSAKRSRLLSWDGVSAVRTPGHLID